MNLRPKKEAQITKTADAFEAAVASLSSELNIEIWEARRLQRTLNVMDHLAEEVAEKMELAPGSDVREHAEKFRGAITSPQVLQNFIQTTEISQMFLAWAHNSINDAKRCIMRGDAAAAMEVMTHVAGLMFGAAVRLSADARANSASKAARASHVTHDGNKQKARDWYATHRTMTKDAAAEKMAKDGIVHASFRTIRGYLSGQ